MQPDRPPPAKPFESATAPRSKRYRDGARRLWPGGVMHTSIYAPDRYECDPQYSLRPSTRTVNRNGCPITKV